MVYNDQKLVILFRVLYIILFGYKLRVYVSFYSMNSTAVSLLIDKKFKDQMI